MKSNEKPGELSTILGKGSVVDGNIKVELSLRIDGKVIGDVVSGDTLIVGAEGEIKGNVHVKNLVLGGKITGTVLAPGRTVLEARSELRGELKTGKLVIDEGAFFDGKCSMSEDKSGAKTERSSDKEAIIK
ncbi:MAG TPA: polymer-forming cytoskeletal protein [bacterium]|nr:polymer-forming cytoskeletal protein [bacterium]HQG45976.1 polymer-forming cytoskeletal protein [bacterium]HQI49248.1 polymer-forming cytoskeletal protein [bacterium]HQJ63572.1 polymer-forming cytoskeletal protein [bacterium]